MNPTLTNTSNQNRNLFEGAFESLNEFEKVAEENNLVDDTEERKQLIREGWQDFYNLKTENITGITNERPVRSVEISETRVEIQTLNTGNISAEERFKPDFKPVFAIENAKGSGSLLEETGIVNDIKEKTKGFVKSLLGVFSLFGEIFLDTVGLVTGEKKKKGKKVEKPETDPEKAKAKAEKKAENQKKQNNIKAFFDGLRAQTGAVASADALRMDVQEKANINLTAKIGQESYKGIKDSFGRLTIYATAMFERAQLDQEKKAKKQEKEMKIASAGGKGPDLNMDKVAEGGFLSSTGGQGAG